ncbi:fumarylacetoacetate hydrolase family protein [Parvularcula dongshanensis]|uniref:fumarylacetoacetate hydrolase family protein n=1 Tax=Parvularcula dongshanensis TaxID=1173995 RepID=UPI003CCCCF4F
MFCVGKNYADHVREMGGDPQDTPPVFFTKPADAVSAAPEIRYPLATENLHFEGELVVALKAGGERLSEDEARTCLFGIAAGCDLTRRDLQAAAKKAGGPWDTAKALDDGAVLGPIAPVDEAPAEGFLRTRVNGELRQDGRLEDMIWPVPALIAKLSEYFELKAGDLVFTGTPEGVGAIGPGDAVTVEIEGCAPCAFGVVPR